MTKKAKKKTRPRNASDLTLRNLRQANRRLAALEAEFDIMRACVKSLEDRMHDLRTNT